MSQITKALPKIGATLLSSLLLATTFSTLPAQATETTQEAVNPFGAVVTPGSNIIDTSSWQSVYDAYQSKYVPATKVPINWTGNASTCSAGTQSAESLQKGADVLNFYRGMTGVGGVGLDPAFNSQAQQAALMMHANGQLNHYPPSTWKCYSTVGAETAGKSNLYGGPGYTIKNAADSINAYMDDYGANNEAVGHRRWVLEPTTTTMGMGTTSSFNALKVVGTSTSTNYPNPAWITFPSEGYFPQQLLPTSKRWSLSSEGVNFANASVTVKDMNGTLLPVKKLPVQNGYGPDTIAFEVSGVQNAPGEEVRSYTVHVANMSKNNQPLSYTYTVRLVDGNVDPATPHASHPSISSVGDIVAADSAGVLWNYGNLKNTRVKIGSGWHVMKEIHVVDWDNDKVADIIAQRKDGGLVYYKGKASGGFTATNIGAGWGPFETVVQKWKKTDTYPSIIAKNTSTGDLFVYGNANGSTITSKTKIGSGWGALSITATDWDKNGATDILAKRSDGKLLLYRTDGNGRFVSETRKIIGSGWNVMNKMTAIDDFRTMGTNGMLARDTNGYLNYYPIYNGTWGTKERIGAGWASYVIAKH